MNGLLTDLYELTMAAGYFESGKAGEKATFEFAIRRLPAHRNYIVIAGIPQIVDYLLNVSFTAEEIAYLRALPQFAQVSSAFFDYLRDFRFTGDLFAVPEGTVLFAGEQDGAFGDGEEIAGEAEAAQVVEEGGAHLGELGEGAQVGDFLGGEAQVEEVVGDLGDAGYHRVITVGGQTADGEFECGLLSGLARLEVAGRHGEFVKVGKEAVHWENAFSTQRRKDAEENAENTKTCPMTPRKTDKTWFSIVFSALISAFLRLCVEFTSSWVVPAALLSRRKRLFAVDRKSVV